MKLIDNLLMLCVVVFGTVIVVGFVVYIYMEIISMIIEERGWERAFGIAMVVMFTIVLILIVLKFIFAVLEK